MITDDNPFDDMPEDSGAFGGAAPPPRPPKHQEEEYVPPARPPKPEATTTTTSSVTIDMAEYERRLADLEARERAVEERERKVAHDQSQVDQKMQQAAQAMQNSKPAPNWPPCFPKKVVYQNFSEEIPAVVRLRVRMAYIRFLVFLVILLYNLVCAIACLACGAEAIGDIILACIYLPFLTGLAFFVYRRLYKAAKSGNSLSYFLFFIGFTVEILIGIAAVVGVPKSGLMGIGWTIKAFGKDGDKNVGCMCLINAILWGINVGFMIYLWIHIRVNFQQAGGIKAMRKQALEKATFGAVKAAKEHPDAAKKVGQAAVDYARENPDVVRDVATAAYSAQQE